MNTMQSTANNLIDSYWELFVTEDRNTDIAFSFIYNHYSQNLYDYGIRLGYPEYVCKDAMHDTFYHLYIARKKLSAVDKKASYLFKTFKNKLIDTTRTKSNRNVNIDQIDLSDFSIKITALDTIIDEETTERLVVLVNNLLSNLTSHQKEVVYLRYMQNMSYDEIASILNITNDSARKLVYRSLESLRNKMLGVNYQDLFLLFWIISYYFGVSSI